MLTKDDIKEVYEALRDRKINPAGNFDNQGRFYATNKELINVRYPTRNWPYSQLLACRSLRYVKKVAETYDVQDKEQLLRMI